MNLLMKQDKPDCENNKLYYLMDEQWSKLTAHDMRSALIDEKQGKIEFSYVFSSPKPHATPQDPNITSTSDIPYALGISILQEKY